MKTYSAKPSEVEAKWHLIDAEGVTLGRLAVLVATKLRGKDKVMYTPHIDCGDHVVIVNADKVVLTGKKRDNKKFFWHTGHPGGIKERTMKQILEGDHPERVVQKAVQRMIPKGPLGRKQFAKLRVYTGTDHPHTAQEPQVIDMGKLNNKNKRHAG